MELVETPKLDTGSKATATSTINNGGGQQWWWWWQQRRWVHTPITQSGSGRNGCGGDGNGGCETTIN